MKAAARRLHSDAQIIRFPEYQRFAAAAYASVRHRATIHGLLEVDVTQAREVLRAHRARTGETLSFTAFIATCMARAVDEHRSVQAFRRGRRHLVVFDDVDVCTRVERDVAGQTYVIPYILRAANRKTFRELHEEIRAAQTADVRGVLDRFRFVPDLLYRPLVWAFTAIGHSFPRLWKEAMGTVGLSSVGMFGSGAGWGIPLAAPTALMVTVGGIGERAQVVDGRVVTRELLSLTISVDHDLVDGGPAARFTERLKELIERGHGLDAIQPERPAASLDGDDVAAPQRSAGG